MPRPPKTPLATQPVSRPARARRVKLATPRELLLEIRRSILLVEAAETPLEISKRKTVLYAISLAHDVQKSSILQERLDRLEAQLGAGQALAVGAVANMNDSQHHLADADDGPHLSGDLDSVAEPLLVGESSTLD